MSLADIGHEEDDGENDAKRANNNVANGEEVVLASEHVGRRQHKVFLTLEFFHVVVVLDLHGVDALLERQRVTVAVLTGVELTVKLAEVGKTGCPHPDNEMLISDVDPLNILPLPGSWHIVDFGVLVLELVLSVRFPCNTGVVDSNVLGGYFGRRRLIVLPHFIGVIEQTLGDETARDGRLLTHVTF